ncbi:threonine/serine ThrE exporter family protein [Aeoliella sp. SH292]|uniref:threonine/serine ThrE exporter family protein n=1 Tax=Aeoliella sp. SH292 TaxID=3454464 RepID=UPI003F9DE7D0
MKDSSSDSECQVVLAYLLQLAQAHLACGEQTAEVEHLLRRAALAYGLHRPRAIVFPTAIFICVHDDDGEHTTMAEGPTESLRLDQIADVYNLGDATKKGQMTARQGLKELKEILAKPPRFGAAIVVLGHTILTVGVAMLFMPTEDNLIAAAILGTIVGVLRVLNRNRPVLAVPLSVVAATLVSSLVFSAMKYGLPVEPLHALVPPLITFLPGAMLTLGMVELAYGDMVSGSSRLVTGLVQLILLVLGLVAGAMLVGYQPADLLEASDENIDEHWRLGAKWVGALVFGIGAYLHFSAPKKSLGWLLLVLVLVFGTQQLAGGAVGMGGSAFLGMLVATPMAYLIQLRLNGPPAMVTFLPSFWLLVPGALGLLSVKQMLSDRAAGIDGLVAMLFVFTSIALGSLVGATLYRTLSEWLGWQQQQLNRVGRYLRRRKKP